MNNEILTKKSKWLSKHLRHSPQRIGLRLEDGGWVNVQDLLEAARQNHMSLSRADLEEVVRSNDKKRFSFSPDGTKIRANQGHSVQVDLQLNPVQPPPTLYHGTGAQNRESILREGLNKGRRHHVHLSREVGTAVQVGARHGKPLVFAVDALRMHADGFEFFVSDNAVWLCEEVPPQYLSIHVH